jgi:cytochrome P450
MSVSTSTGGDLLTAERVDDPYPYFRRLRAEDPVHWSEAHHAWMLLRHDDVTQAFRDARLSADRVNTFVNEKVAAEDRGSFDAIVRLLGNWMVFKDPPDHGRLRRLVHMAFTTRIVERSRSQIVEAVDGLVGELERRGASDFVSDFAAPLPAIVIARMLGVPPEDHERFREWSNEVMNLVFGASGDADRHGRATRGLLALEGYFRDLLDRRRRAPTEDLLTALSVAEEKGDVLTADEVISTCILLLFAGHETTTNLLANGFLALYRNPAEREKLARHPELAASAVEELLRYDGPSKVMVRYVSEDHELRGRRIRRGQRVFLVQAAANRDPERFPDAERLDVARGDNDHLAFGYGIHFCLGAPLARLEGQLTFPRLLQRLPGLRVTAEHPEWHPTIVSRGLKSLPVSA